MGRSGYDDGDGYDEFDHLRMEGYRRAFFNAINGKRGQTFLRELRDALDALPEKRLCEYDLQTPDGQCCALGAIGRYRGIDMTKIDPEAHEYIANLLNVAAVMVREIEFENDNDLGYNELKDYSWYMREKSMTFDDAIKAADEARWQYMRDWVDRRILRDGEDFIRVW